MSSDVRANINQRGTDRERVFFTACDRVLYVQSIRENMEQAGVQVLAHYLMTNHVHFEALYHSCAMSGTHKWVGLMYVEMNPCRAGMVKSAEEEYRWSSARAHLTNKGDGGRILDMDFWAKAGGTETWGELHRREVPGEQERELRNCTCSGRPLGRKGW